MTESGDPGWPPLWRMLVPVFRGFARRLANAGTDPLVIQRQVFAGFISTLIYFGVVLPFVHGRRSGPVVPAVAILGAIAVAVTIVSSRIERPLRCDSEATLASLYRTRMFLRIAFAQSIALWAFVFSFGIGPWWTYYVGAAFALASMWLRAAPTAAALAREQDTLNAGGCGLLLVHALRTTPFQPRDRRRRR